ncbi:MAG: type II secretion system protein J, partial [Intestinibacter bartlettii]
MKVRQGYILLEVIVCTFIMSMLIMVLYSIIISAINTKDNIEDKIELNQQAEEMEYHIKNIVENSINIINITTTDNEVIETLQENKTYNVLSIKLNFKSDDENINSKNKKDNQEISFKRDLKKIFINTLYDDNSNKAGGYE